MGATATFDYDVAVVGGGPAGAAAAGRLQRRGCRAVVVESERFPRFHIGESLLPLGNRVFDELGCRSRVEGHGFAVKRGAQLRSPCGEHSVLFDFAANRVDPSTTVQVHRAEFDFVLLEHARSLGADVVEARARDYAVDRDGVTLTIAPAAGGERRLRVQALVDASGRSGFVAKREGVRVPDEELRKASVYAHFRGVARDAPPRDGDTRIVSLPNLGWIWLIPLAGDVTSVGVVIDVDHYQQLAKGDLEALFWRAVQDAPLVSRLLAGAERVSPFGAESGFSYRAERYAGDRWLLAGDAGSFLDPVWSTGVQMALMGGIEAADAVVDAYVRKAASPARALRRYDRRQQDRYRFVRRFVTGFYDAATRDLFFAPRRYLGIHRAVTRVLAGGFDLGPIDRLRLKAFFLLARLQARYDLVPRLASRADAAVDRSEPAAPLAGMERP